MNSELVNTLLTLRANPAVVVELYSQLYSASFLAVVQSDSADNLNSSLFLTYPCDDGVRELSLFTRLEFMFGELPDDAAIVEVEGPVLWQRLLNIVVTGECEAAVDPGQSHGIRLNREMVLAITNQYGPQGCDSDTA